MKKRRKMFMKRMAAVILTLCMIMGMVPSVITVEAHGNSDGYPYNVAAGSYVADQWGFYQCECTSFVAWCLNARNGFGFSNGMYGSDIWGNANNWGDVARRHGFAVDGNPAVGAVAWSSSGTYGHVAWVCAVNGDNVTIDEYNNGWVTIAGEYHGNHKYNTRTVPKSAFQYIHLKDIPQVTTTPTVSEVWIEGQNAEGYMIGCRVSGEAVSGVSVTSWINGGGQTDQTWIEMVPFGNGIYKLFVQYSDHYNDSSSTYYNVIFAYNPAGHGSKEIMFTPMKRPEVSNVWIESANAEGYMVGCKVSGEGVNRARVTTWINGGGQTDQTWDEMESFGNGVYKYFVKYSNHYNDSSSTYYNVVFAYNDVGHGSKELMFAPTNKPKISDIHIVDADSGGYTIECKIDSYNVLSDAQVATWTTSNGQDDLQTKNLERQSDGLTYRCYIPYSDHNNEKGSYENLISVKSITGEESQMITHCNELHNWNAGNVLKKARCNEPGLKEYTCIECNETKREEIPAVGHSYSERWYYDEVKHWHIAICGHELKSDETEHNFSWVIDRAATEENTGIKHEECGTCGCMRNEGTVIDAVDSISLSQTSYVYNGKTKKPSVMVKDSSGKMLRDKADYTVYYFGKAKNVGSYTVTITLKGNYSGIVKKTFEIVPKGTLISKISAQKKGFAINWKKQTKQTSGYEIAYSTSNKFVKKNTKTVTVKKNKNSSKSISKLKAKKKYYVKIRTYKTVRKNGKSVKIYSAWSKAKTVTTKK